jgi:hypothetical protein
VERLSPTRIIATDVRRAADVTGLYTVNFSTQGSPMTLTLRIDKKESGGYGGQMTGESLPPLPITSIKVSGNSVKIAFTAPDNTEGTITFVLASDNTARRLPERRRADYSAPGRPPLAIGDGAAGSGVKSSPGLMNWSRSRLYCLS